MTSEETAEIKQEIIGLENRYQRSMRECFYLEGQIHRLKQKLIVISPEEVRSITEAIGKNLPEKPWQNAHAIHKEVGE